MTKQSHSRMTLKKSSANVAGKSFLFFICYQFHFNLHTSVTQYLKSTVVLILGSAMVSRSDSFDDLLSVDFFLPPTLQKRFKHVYAHACDQ